MAMSVVYTTINGMIVHENRGGVESFYAPDTMGSTVALLNSSGVVTDTYTYWPYGEIRSHVGSSQTPFTFLGMIGYYTDVVGNFIYVRARYLRQALTRWQTADPLWPHEPPYAYCSDTPQVKVDPSGEGGQPRCQGNNRHKPPKCPAGQTAVWITCFEDKDNRSGPGKGSVFCSRKQCSGCRNYTTPVCPIGTQVVVPGYGDVDINQCGCLETGRPPSPDLIIDVWIDGCTDLACWVCMHLPPACHGGGRRA